jgi:ATP-dependent Lhr-like helicase
VDVTKLIKINVEIPTIKKIDFSGSKRLHIEPNSFASIRRCKELIDSHKSTLFFINTRDGAEILSSRFHMWLEDYPIGVHHGSLSKIARVEAEDSFKKGDLKCLICTSSLELGIDVGDTDFIIQYSSPREVKRILQRIGRSGHKVGKISNGSIIATTSEDFAESVVISRKALKGEIEKILIRMNPLSVLANQIISIALEYGKIKSDTIFQIIKRTYIFHSISKEIFDMVINQLQRQRSIWIDDNGIISKRASSRNYFIENISMIPDEKSFMVVNISTRRKIGKLDESFVLNYGFEGAKFILKGIPWSIIKREEDEILVNISKEIGNIPSWTGEDIPVPYMVAKEVGKLRRIVLNQELTQILEEYPCKENELIKLKKDMINQVEQGYKIPDDSTITIDFKDKTIVINACFGTKINETLGRLISAIIAQSIGESIAINNDAYRINLELPTSISPKRIKEILLNTKPESLYYLLKTILKNSTFIRWQLVHVARKFGAIGKEFDYRNIGKKRLFKLFENSLIFDEAVEKTIWERMDIENTKKILNDIQSEDINIIIQGLSPISFSGLETIRGLMVPQKADRSILMALRNRLEDTEVTLVCVNCNKSWDTVVRRIQKKPVCSSCNAIKIAVLNRYNKNLVKILGKTQRTKDEEKEFRRIYKNSSLVLSYEKPAILALLGRGIGPDTAARILRKHNLDNFEKSEEIQIRFLRDLLKAELLYAKTRSFWDSN